MSGQQASVTITSPDTSAEAPKPAENQQQQQAPATERPAWLPEKFKDAEQMAQAYAELEKKQGGGGEQKPDEKAEGAAPAAEEKKPDEQAALGEVVDALKTAGLNVDNFTAEVAKEGKLSEESYKALAEKGYPKAMVDIYVQGLQASAASYEAKVYEAVGGADAYKELSTWAAKNVSQDELKAFNEIVDGGDPAKAAMAAAGLKTKMEAALGKEPNLLNGDSKAGSDAYQSWQEVQADMQDPRYRTDPAFNKRVTEKALRSKL